jgi:hypothetical protein
MLPMFHLCCAAEKEEARRKAGLLGEKQVFAAA